jgi:dolichol-phosphate mannosyltransferase
MQKVYWILFYLTEGLFDYFMTHLSVVVPVFNEESLIGELVKRVKTNAQLISDDFEIILIDDGSQDKTWELIENEANTEKRVKGLKFSRNFGHHYAITAGLHNASGEWVIVMDGDLQDRPEVIPELYQKSQTAFHRFHQTLLLSCLLPFLTQCNNPTQLTCYHCFQKRISL